MDLVTFRFYAELNDFLPSDKRQVAFGKRVAPGTAVKDAIEALGIPHTEVDLVLLNGESVAFSHPLAPGDRVAAFPVFESLDIAPLARARPQPLRDPRFVADGHLGRLARYLRMLGFDTLYRSDIDDADLAEASHRERRILLTRDRELLKRSRVRHGYFIRATDPRLQLRDVLRRFDLTGKIRPFERCIRCNGRLRHASRDEVRSRLPPRTSREHDEFWSCQGCRRVYWRGSHVRRMEAFIRELGERG